jgi:hypothetical protein
VVPQSGMKFHFGELFPRAGFIVTNLETDSLAVVQFYKKNLFPILTICARIRLIFDIRFQMCFLKTLPREAQQAAIRFTKGYGEFRHQGTR